MRKFTSVLVIVAVLFAAVAIVISLGGTFFLNNKTEKAINNLPTEAELLKQARAELEPEMRIQVEKELREQIKEEMREAAFSEPPTLAEIGITFEAPKEWGSLIFDCSYESLVNASGKLCKGEFTDSSVYTYVHAPFGINQNGPSRGAFIGDITGYEQVDARTDVLFSVGGRRKVPEEQVNGFIDAVNTEVFVVNGSGVYEPDILPAELGTRMAIVNVSNDRVTSLTLVADDSISRDVFRELLESIKLIEAETREL